MKGMLICWVAIHSVVVVVPNWVPPVPTPRFTFSTSVTALVPGVMLSVPQTVTVLSIVSTVIGLQVIMVVSTEWPSARPATVTGSAKKIGSAMRLQVRVLAALREDPRDVGRGRCGQRARRDVSARCVGRVEDRDARQARECRQLLEVP